MGGGGAHPLHPPPRSAPGISEQKVKQVNFLLFHFFLLFVVIIIFCIFVGVVVVAVRIFWPNRFFLQSN